MAEPQLKHELTKVKDLIQGYRSGLLVIPEFQRDYVWRKSRAPVLIDSMYRSFPISSLLVWESSAPVRARSGDKGPARVPTATWLIDGQQRVITLDKVANGGDVDDGIEVLFSPKSDEFRLPNAVIGRDKSGWLRVADIWNDERYRQIRRDIDADGHAADWEARLDKVRRVLDYEVPIIRMVNHQFKGAVDAFKRINTLGVKLKKEDIERAEVAARHSGFIADKFVPFLGELHKQGFDRLNFMHLLRACEFVATPDGRNRTPLYKLEISEVEDAWHATEKATKKAISLVKSELGLENMEILWSGSLLVPIIVICANTPPRNLDSGELAGWLAAAALTRRYARHSGDALEQDLKCCRSEDPLGGLLANLRGARGRQHRLSAQPEDFGGAVADRSGLLALFIACKQRGICDFYTGQKITLQGDIHRHHILPRGQFPAESRARADVVANIAFISGGVNRVLSSSGPEVYLKDLSQKVLLSQCIPADPSLWAIERTDEFWAERKRLLASAFNDFLHSSLPKRRLCGT